MNLWLYDEHSRADRIGKHFLERDARNEAIMVQNKREVTSIKMKRKHINILQQDSTGNKAPDYGHWWFEIGDARDVNSESYGWWPREPVSKKDTLTGGEGELNGVYFFGGTSKRDPHHGDSADIEFHPLIAVGDTRSDEEIAECLRRFARAYSGEWCWTLGKGQNCHTFQRHAMNHCGLSE